MLRSRDRVVLLQHRGLGDNRGKTGLAFLRYREGPVVAVIDPDHAGRPLHSIAGIERDVPVLGSMAEALPFAPEVAVVGLAPSGGMLPPELRADLETALKAGLSVASGLHTRIGADPDLSPLVQPGRWIWDLRQEPPGLSVGSARASAMPGVRLLTVGTDMSVGKMSACLELQAAARRRGVEARFVGTGQAGILISGTGVPLDAVRVDYASGAVEQAVLRASAGAGRETLLLVEGQGSLCHPGSSATLSLIRGSQPTTLLLVHRAGQGMIQNHPHIPIPKLPALIEVLEGLAALARPAPLTTPAPQVVAVALNTAGLDGEASRAALHETQAETGLPCFDPVRHGGEGLLSAVMAPAR